MGRLWMWLDRLLCLMGGHRWSHPGGHCESCGKCDLFFGPHPRCTPTDRDEPKGCDEVILKEPRDWNVIILQSPEDAEDKEPRVAVIGGLSVFPRHVADRLASEARELAARTESGIHYTVEPIGRQAGEREDTQARGAEPTFVKNMRNRVTELREAGSTTTVISLAMLEDLCDASRAHPGARGAEPVVCSRCVSQSYCRRAGWQCAINGEVERRKHERRAHPGGTPETEERDRAELLTWDRETLVDEVLRLVRNCDMLGDQGAALISEVERLSAASPEADTPPTYAPPTPESLRAAAEWFRENAPEVRGFTGCPAYTVLRAIAYRLEHRRPPEGDGGEVDE